MGMCFALCTLSDENIRKVLSDPPLIWRVLAPDDPEPYEQARRESSGLLRRLFKGRAPSASADIVFSEGEGENTDIDKSWHGIHYLLTQSVWDGSEPLNFIVKGGESVGDIDVGYGPARVLTSGQVHALNRALGPLDASYLQSRFDPPKMVALDIYPKIWDRDPADDDTLGYCCEYFEVLKDFVAQAAARNLGLVLYLS